MAIWQVEIFENSDDKTPIKRGFVEAETDGQAANLVVKAMGYANSANLKPVTKKLPTIPQGLVLWDAADL